MNSAQLFVYNHSYQFGIGQKRCLYNLVIDLGLEIYSRLNINLNLNRIQLLPSGGGEILY